MTISANWIWLDDSDGRGYNLAAKFRRTFQLDSIPACAELKISADSAYRVQVNGEWVLSGPCRAYPEHYRYDSIDLADFLQLGENCIEAEVHYWGCGSFHQIPQRGGFLAQLDCGDDLQIMTDESWSAAPLTQWISNTPKSSCQQEPFEFYDATRSDAQWLPAKIISGPPWRDLQQRDVPPLSCREFPLREINGIARVSSQYQVFAVNGQQLVFPKESSVESSSTFPVLLALCVHSPRAQRVKIVTEGVRLAVNGKIMECNEVKFILGENFLVAVPEDISGHVTTWEIGFPVNAELLIGSPYNDAPRPAVVFLPECTKIERSTPAWGNAAYQQRKMKFQEEAKRALAVKNASEFRSVYSEGRTLTPGELCDDSAALSFVSRQPEATHFHDVEEPENLISLNDRCTVIHPVPGGGVELCCDLGEQNIGYWEFALFAPTGTTVDIFAVEYITQDRKVQHTVGNRNGMRYICHAGYNRYRSFRRRSGRYLFLTLRNFNEPIRFQFLRLLESTYPIVPQAYFNSSDDLLNRIYEISTRTLKLCMEDTFTDCPLYEQTLWVGDARTESLFAMSCFGAYDLVRRCIRLAGQSLEHLPLVGSQVPSGWSSIIPVWSFMWVLSAMDYYEETGDTEFLREVWPQVKLNLDNACGMIAPQTGLFASQEWNFFEWSQTVTEEPVLLYNSIFLAEALRAGYKAAEVLKERNAEQKFRKHRADLIEAFDRQWDETRHAWPDSIRGDGTVSPESSVHTSMLAILFDAVSEKNFEHAKRNTVSPSRELIPVASPFASFYLYQAMEKIDQVESILAAMRCDYAPMLELGATTVWESYPSARMVNGEFPTRSHCHAWSSAPLYFLPRLVLGIRSIAPGGKRFMISPHPGTLEWARGMRPSVAGNIQVEWKRNGNEFHIYASAPAEVELVFETNRMLKEYTVFFNGKCISESDMRN